MNPSCTASWSPKSPGSASSPCRLPAEAISEIRVPSETQHSRIGAEGNIPGGDPRRDGQDAGGSHFDRRIVEGGHNLALPRRGGIEDGAVRGSRENRADGDLPGFGADVPGRQNVVEEAAGFVATDGVEGQSVVGGQGLGADCGSGPAGGVLYGDVV
jgi:hypothetical protein